MQLDMLFIVLLEVQGYYNKSYSSCAWHLCCEIDECLIVYFGGRDDLQQPVEIEIHSEMAYALHPECGIIVDITAQFVFIGALSVTATVSHYEPYRPPERRHVSILVLHDP